jgi:DNA-binding transcriptional MocR family regulator
MTAMPPLLLLNTYDSTPLTQQIVDGIKRLVDEKILRDGTRLPSIRDFSIRHKVSRFTVVEAYDRLVAQGYLSSRRGSGFYVNHKIQQETSAEGVYHLDRAVDILWLLHNTFQDGNDLIKPGCGWLPGHWLDELGIQKSLRELSKKSGDFLTSYGNLSGYIPLRQQLQFRLSEIGVGAEIQQIIITNGATHGLDLAARLLVKPGDAVLVDDPGYYTLFGYLKTLGAKLIGVPRNLDGPDLASMELLIQEHHPKLFFTNSVLHNPTGTCTSFAVAHKLLQMAEQYGIYIVEDDIYGDFHPGGAPRLATLDQLNRVIYVSSFSKTISASLRIGFIACHPELAKNLLDLKLLSGLTTSDITQRLIHQILIEGQYRKHINRVRTRLQETRGKVINNLEKCGLTIDAQPAGGMFIWAQLPNNQNAAEIASLASHEGITLAPGNLFKPYHEPSPWLRFNAAHSEDPRIFEFLLKHN